MVRVARRTWTCAQGEEDVEGCAFVAGECGLTLAHRPSLPPARVWQALPTSYETVAPASSPGRTGRVARVVSAAAMVMFACAALVALLGSATEQKRASLLAVTPDQSLDALALQFLKHGATMSVKDMEHKLDAWHNSPATLLDISKDVGAGRTQMLALGPRASGESFGQALDGKCARLALPREGLGSGAAGGEHNPSCAHVTRGANLIVHSGQATAPRSSARRRTSSSRSSMSFSRSWAVRSSLPTSLWARSPPSGRRPCR